MKTFKQILPAFAIMLALGGAFGTYAMNNSGGKGALTNFRGHIKNNPLGTSCTESIMCTDVNGPLCTVNGQPTGTQLWKKNDQNRCVDEIYKIQ
ncbi:hypothetical protein D0817_10630 [Flavobacterium cupreum]|jgi:hypothetical protein|uniref:DUF333 domain-containing protein n=1 Tax=Flavobacterium cupreum TaxID=2133766 RepID=A0A434A7E9_9FLAO|nr:DUF6520 family protein [Flavobacterium cupreum]RUT70267.1 hypothetical protein D0817_10630 [Flavobacterium cupreum]